VIEHPDFMPPELQKRPDLWQGKDKAASGASCGETRHENTATEFGEGVDRGVGENAGARGAVVRTTHSGCCWRRMTKRWSSR